MLWLIVKYAITAGMVVLISEVAKRSDRLGGLIAGTTSGHRVGADLDETGRTKSGKDRQPCLVHLLVRSTDIANVCCLSVSVSALGTLAHAGGELYIDHLVIFTLGNVAQAI